MIHLYCLEVQAGFYSDVVECWPVMQAAQVRSPVMVLVIMLHYSLRIRVSHFEKSRLIFRGKYHSFVVHRFYIEHGRSETITNAREKPTVLYLKHKYIDYIEK